MVLGYFELPEDEQPSELIWHHPERLEEWNEAIKQRREHGYEPVPPADEEPDMTSNEFARQVMGDE